MARRRSGILALLLIMIVALAAGCARSVDGEALSVGQAQSQGDGSGNVDTDQFDRLTLECAILQPAQIAEVVGGSTASSNFSGAICRWFVSGTTSAYVTFNWFEQGSVDVEKRTAKELGYTTENIKIASQAAFTARDTKRPSMCGVTTRSPTRGVYTFWVEPLDGSRSGDPCAAPTKLMELLLNGGQ